MTTDIRMDGAQPSVTASSTAPEVPAGFSVPQPPPISTSSPAAAFAPVPRRGLNVARFLRHLWLEGRRINRATGQR